MKSLHDTNIVRPDIKQEDIKDVDLNEMFGQYTEYLKEKYVREDGTIISKGIFENSVYNNCEGFENKLEKYFGKEYFREVVYCLLKDMQFIPRCPVCHNLNYLRDWTKGFQDFCCRKCINRYQTSDEWKSNVVKKSMQTRRLNYKNEKLDKLGLKCYNKDPENGNYILIYDYCKHHYGDNPLKLYFNTLNKLLSVGRGTLCIECNKEIYDNYHPTKEDNERFLSESVLFFRDYGSVINNEDLSMKFFPKERKILDTYFETEVSGEHKDEIVSLNERNYYFEKQLKEIPCCRYPGCNQKPRYHRLKAYNLYCDCHLNDFHGQSEFERNVCDYIRRQNINISENERHTLSGQEIDILCNEYNIGIECNGTFYHSDLNHSKYYHLNKRIKADKCGLHLYSIWSDSWDKKSEVCKKYIRRWFGISTSVNDIISCEAIDYESISFTIENNYLYDVDKNSEFYIAKSNEENVVAIVEVFSKDNQYVSVRIIQLNEYVLEKNAYSSIIRFLNNLYRTHINIEFDMDVDTTYNLPENLHFSGVDLSAWMWFRSGRRYRKDEYSDSDKLQKCYNSGTAVYSTDSTYHIKESFDANSFEDDGDNVTRIAFDDIISAVSDEIIDITSDNVFNADYCILYRGLKIYVDYKCNSYFKRAYTDIKEDREISTYIRNSKDDELIKKLDIWELEEPAKRKIASDNNILFLEVYSCESEDDLRNQLDMLYYSVNSVSCIENIGDLKTEFDYYSKLICTNPIGDYKVSQKNSIVKHFQMGEFYKTELNIYAYNPELRRKLIQNRIKYLFKKESALTYADMINGFKKSGIHYGYSHFNPAWTNWFIYRYCITSVYDPFGGWGHHMLGMLKCRNILYNDNNLVTCKNIESMKRYFGINQLTVHHGDAAEYIPETDVDAFFMCPPYYNTEVYESRFKSFKEYSNLINSVFDIWEKTNAKIIGIILREDFEPIIRKRYEIDEVYDMSVGESHFVKSSMHNKKFKERFYIIFKK